MPIPLAARPWLLGLTRGSLLGLGLASLGGAMLYRGLGGHCPLYAATGINTAGRNSGSELVYRRR